LPYNCPIPELAPKNSSASGSASGTLHRPEISAGIIHYMKQLETRLILGDCHEELVTLRDNSIDLIFTSPPYADSRVHTYGSVSPKGIQIGLQHEL